MSYQPIMLEDFRRELLPKGFVQVDGPNSEITFERAHERDPRMKIKIYTSIAYGSVMTRDCGTDAIRVCLTLDRGDRTVGLGKTKRVNRTGPAPYVVQRAIQRAREMWQDGQSVVIY